MVLDLKRKTFLLITGASRSIGRTMALRLAEKLKPGSVIALLSRNHNALNQVKAEILNNSSSSHLQVETYPIDFSFAAEADFRDILNSALVNRDVSDFDRAFIIHNVGTIGDVTKSTREQDQVDSDGVSASWRKYMHTNLFSTIALNMEFFKRFASIEKIVVNVTSLCALKPFASMSYYCTGKAAREMYFRVLALEESDTNTIVLNYSPGAVDTDMTQIIQNYSINQPLRNSFKEQRESKTMLTTEQTTKKFLEVLEKRSFQSGDHFDYYD